MASVRTLFAELTPELGQVQARSELWVCNVCMGPVRHFACCFACGELMKRGAPQALLDAVVPASIATNPGRWFNRLMTYKAGNPAFRAHVAALAWSYLEQHEARLEEMAGGAIDIVTPVPSKKDQLFADQPLQQSLAAVRPIGARLADTLRFVPEDGLKLRHNYYPECFEAGPTSVDGKRVLLIEDSWVTGATAISAGGALLKQGAQSVTTLSLARIVDVEFWDEHNHEYLARILPGSDEREAYDISKWRR